jgi:hypothetical protein
VRATVATTAAAPATGALTVAAVTAGLTVVAVSAGLTAVAVTAAVTVAAIVWWTGELAPGFFFPLACHRRDITRR